jgi:hypothetical protein
MEEKIWVCYEKDLSTRFFFVNNNNGKPTFCGLNNPTIKESIRGKHFNSLKDLHNALIGPEIKCYSKNYYLTDENGNLTNERLNQYVSKMAKNIEHNEIQTTNKKQKTKHETSRPVDLPLSSENSTLTVQNLKNISRDIKTNKTEISSDNHFREFSISDMNPSEEKTKDSKPSSVASNNEPPSSIFDSSSMVKIEPKPERVEEIEHYDNPKFLSRKWITREEISNGNNKWNTLASFYSMFLYIEKSLQWPLSEVRVVINYQKNAVKFSKIIPEIYKRYGISDKLKVSDNVTRLVVWCIASMNSFGIVRPLLFEGSTEKAFRMSSMCSVKQKYNGVIYYITWPFKADGKNIYVVHNQTKLKEVKVKETFLLDFDLQTNPKKILKKIPDWLYSLALSVK